MRKNQRKTRLIGLLLAAVTATFLLAGCGEGTLESYLEEHPEEMDAMQRVFSESEMSMDVKDNTVYWTYTYDEVFDSTTIEMMASIFQQQDGELQSAYGTLMDLLQEKSGIEEISVELRFEDADHTEIYTHYSTYIERE